MNSNPTLSSHRCASGNAFSLRCLARAGLPAALALTLAACMVARPASSETVSCATADTPAEFAICNSETLQTLDRKVDDAFKAVFSSAGDRASRQQLTREQVQWTIEREACKADTICLENQYTTRLGELADGDAAALVSPTELASGN